MKKSWLLMLVIPFFLIGCNPIPDKTIFEKLTTDELAKAIKSDTSFASFYEMVRIDAELTGEVKKAKYNDITYRRLFDYFLFLQDSDYWAPFYEKWGKEWEKENMIYTQKVDSIIMYWENYLRENSLNNYVKIELANILTKWYEYIGGVEEVNLGFRLTPLKGSVEQVRFTYGYQPKINSNTYYTKHKCLYTSPLTKPQIGYWEASYSDQDFFAGKTVEKFLRDYDLYIDVTDIRKNGVNISKDDLGIPTSVSKYLEENSTASERQKMYYKENIIRELVKNDYLSRSSYETLNFREVCRNKDKLCFDYIDEFNNLTEEVDKLTENIESLLDFLN